MKETVKKEKPAPKRCLCGAAAITVKTRHGKMVTCPNPMNCPVNIRTTWRRSEDAAIAEWNTLVRSLIEKRNASTCKEVRKYENHVI